LGANDKIFFIGFMGSGKSTLGKKVANKLGLDFFDLDEEIVKGEGVSVSEIFQQKGEMYFRNLETDYLKQFTEKSGQFLLALGGGTPCFNNNMGLVNEHGLSVYLKYNAGMLHSRLVNAKSSRPLLRDKSDKELKHYIELTLTEREQYYSQAEIIIEDKNISIEKVLRLVQ
jgi:shikimate kinase